MNNPSISQAINLISSLREGQLVRVTEGDREYLMSVSRGPRRSDGIYGSPESTRVTVTLGPGGWSREVIADHVAAGYVGIEPMPVDLSKPYCFYILHTSYDPEHGYIPVIVTEDEAGYAPLVGNGPHARPWYWGKDYPTAARMAEEANEGIGVSKQRALEIVTSSMRAQPGPLTDIRS